MTTEWGAKRARPRPPRAVRPRHDRPRQRGEPTDDVLRQLPEVPRRDRGALPRHQIISNSGPDDSGARFDTLWDVQPRAGRRPRRRALLQRPAVVPAEQRPLRLLRPQRPEGVPRRVRLAGQHALQRAGRGRVHDRHSSATPTSSRWRPTRRCSPTSRLRPVEAGHDLVRQRRVVGLAQLRGPEAVHEQRRRRVVPSTRDRPVVPTPRSRSPAAVGPVDLGDRGDLRRREGHVQPTAAVLFSDDFSAGAGPVDHLAGRGTWSVSDGAYVQSDPADARTP